MYAVNADGRGAAGAGPDPGAAFEGSPAYSPDGRRIAYTCGNFELCVMNADDSAKARLTTNDWPRELRYDTSPAWSPDGTTIAFVRTVAGKDQIWLVAPDGSGAAPAPVPAGVNSSPAFSPDSRTIAFEHAEDQTGDGRRPALELGRRDPRDRRRRQRAARADRPRHRRRGPRVVARRRAHRVYARQRGGNDTIAVMNVDGTNTRRVSSRSSSASDPAWSPDSARIVFSSIGGGGASLRHVPATGGRAVVLTRGPGVDLAASWQPAGPATPAQQAPAPALAPSVATPDARMVGVLLGAFGGFVPIFASLSSDRAGDLLVAARRMDRLARQTRSAARSLQPTSRRARSVRRTVLGTMTLLEDLAGSTRQWARTVRRRGRRAARKQGEGVVFAFAFGVAMPLAAATGEVGVSQAAL